MKYTKDNIIGITFRTGRYNYTIEENYILTWKHEGGGKNTGYPLKSILDNLNNGLWQVTSKKQDYEYEIY